jgi:hypothetical protein
MSKSHQNRKIQNGDIFQNITIKESYVKRTASGDYFHLCTCKCGNEKLMRGGNLKNNKGCGCGNSEKTAGITKGQNFGGWTVIESYTSRSSGRRWNHLCKCKCGAKIEVEGTRLKRGKSLQCRVCRERYKKDGLSSAKKYIYRDYKGGAKRRGYDFNIDFDVFIKMCQEPCHYCGSKNSRKTSTSHKNISYRTHFISNGIDRVDNNIGYTEENCVPCCTTCNSMKMCLGKDEFLTHIQKIYDFNH